MHGEVLATQPRNMRSQQRRGEPQHYSESVAAARQIRMRIAAASRISRIRQRQLLTLQTKMLSYVTGLQDRVQTNQRLYASTRCQVNKMIATALTHRPGTANSCATLLPSNATAPAQMLATRRMRNPYSAIVAPSELLTNTRKPQARLLISKSPNGRKCARSIGSRCPARSMMDWTSRIWYCYAAVIVPLTLLNRVEMSLPSTFAAIATTTAISATMRPYSTIVAPSSSLMNERKPPASFFIEILLNKGRCVRSSGISTEARV